MLTVNSIVLSLLFAAFCFAFLCGSANASGGACPAGVPVTGNNCYFIAASGSDANTGTDEQHPWQHAPGMPNCASNCASVISSGLYPPVWPGIGIIFRGGDTWHFGNNSLSPSTGGTWTWYWEGDISTCRYEGTQTGCDYLGVDKMWWNSSVCGSSWCRPIMTGDNPTSTTYVASCAHHTPDTGTSSNNEMIEPGGDWGIVLIIDNFEITGFCGDTQASTSGPPADTMIGGINTGGDAGDGMEILSNLYIHGWTSTNNILSGPNISNCTALGGGNEGLQSLVNIVIDGSDSLPNACNWGLFPSFYHMKDSMIRYTTNGVGSNCHDIHDNIFEDIVPTGDGTGHTNVLECNADATGNYANQPANTPNVWYNNILRHSNSNVLFWVCPNAMPEYWFNNLFYDSAGEGWAMAGTAQYPDCTATGGQFMFNNTFADGALGGYTALCHGNGSNVSGGVYTTVLNEHLINTAWDGTGCTGGPGSATNVSMTDAQATTQRYTTGVAGTYLSNTCANDNSTPCAPTAASNSTVGAGANHLAYCATLASYTSEPAISVDAANACKYGTTDGCAYNTTTHTMVCPAQTAIARPMSGAWDVGAYQYSSGSSGATPPTVATPASANPNPVTGTATNLSVLGSDVTGESHLTYTWSTTGTPPASVSLSTNTSNAAKNTTATFTKTGSYGFQVVIMDTSSLTVTSSTNVTVNQTLSSITVSPSAATVQVNGTHQFTATAQDQFNQTMAVEPSFSWSVSGGGTISSTGTFTAGSAAGGPYNVTASVNGITSPTAKVTITTATPPGVALTSPVNGATFTAPASITLEATTTPGSNPISLVQLLEDTTVLQSYSNPTTSSFSYDWTNVASGTYQIGAVVTDSQGLSNTSNIATITVNASSQEPAPVINSASSASGTVGTAFSYQITATNSPTSFGSTGLPSGLTVNTGSGLVSGTPSTAGVFTSTITATNSGGTGAALLTLTISGSVGSPTSSFSPRVYPNPWRSDKGYAQQITFDQLTGNTTIKIFTVSGHLVKTLTTSSNKSTWQLDNDSGDKVASGLYLYVIADSQGDKARGKAAIIR